MANSILSELSGLLWRERDVLEQLVERLRAEAPGDDVHSNGLLHSISSLEIHRAITTREVALDFGLEGEPTLRELIQLATEEWAPVLAAHRRALLDLDQELRPLLRGPTHTSGNVVTLPTHGRTVHRSLRDFLA